MMENCSPKYLLNKFKELGVLMSPRDEAVVMELSKTCNKAVDKFLTNFVRHVHKDANTLTSRENELYELAKKDASNLVPSISSINHKCVSDLQEEQKRLIAKRIQLEEKVKRKRHLQDIKDKLSLHQEDKMKEIMLSSNYWEGEIKKWYDKYANLTRKVEDEQRKVYRELSNMQDAYKSYGSNAWCHSETNILNLDKLVKISKNEVKEIETECTKFYLQSNEWQCYMKDLQDIQDGLTKTIKEHVLTKCHYKQLDNFRNSSLPMENSTGQTTIQKINLLDEKIRLYVGNVARKQCEQLYTKQLLNEEKYTQNLDDYLANLIWMIARFRLIYTIAIQRKNRIDELLDGLNGLISYLDVVLNATVQETENMRLVNVKFETNSSQLKVYDKIVEIVRDFNASMTPSEFDKVYKTSKTDMLLKFQKNYEENIETVSNNVLRLKSLVYSRNVDLPIIIPTNLFVFSERIKRDIDLNNKRLHRLKDKHLHNMALWKKNRWAKIRALFWLYFLRDRDTLMKTIDEMRKTVYQQEIEEVLNLRTFIKLE